VLDDLVEKSNLAKHEPIQEFRRMERLWRLYRYRRQAGDRHQQDPAVFYLCFNTYNGFACYHLPRACFLEKYKKIYMGREKKPMVLFVISIEAGHIFFKKELLSQIL